jgi:predicted alpha/beta-fold hydrolase
MGPINAYKDMLDKVVSPIACVNMNRQNQLEQMENGVMFATSTPGWPTLLGSPSVAAVLPALRTRRVSTATRKSAVELEHNDLCIFSWPTQQPSHAEHTPSILE